jgi:hypothetical protein
MAVEYSGSSWKKAVGKFQQHFSGKQLSRDEILNRESKNEDKDLK